MAITMCYSQEVSGNVLSENSCVYSSSLSGDSTRITQNSGDGKISTSTPDMAGCLPILDYPLSPEEPCEISTDLAGVSAYQQVIDSSLQSISDTEMVEVQAMDSSTAATPQKKEHYWPSFALKTNLLFDLGSALNVELEIPIARHWSVAAEWMFPWWIFGGNQYCFEVLSANLEARYWFNTSAKKSPAGSRRDRMLGGFFVGLYAGGGLYDLQWDLKGYQGEFYIASGLSLGYSFNVGKNFNLELSVGAGYMVTDYRHYIMKDNYSILAYQFDGRYTWMGPTRAKVSLVWLIGQTKYAGRRK